MFLGAKLKESIQLQMDNRAEGWKILQLFLEFNLYDT